MAPILRGKNYIAFIGVLVGGIAITLYPIVIRPMMYPDEYRNIQKITRAGIKQEDIQPGNMKVWTDPFAKKSS